MNFKNKIDFCVIPSPYSGGLKNLIFVTYKGFNQIDEKLCMESDYVLIKALLDSYGYQEIDFCTFESSENFAIPISEIMKKISEAGLRYSKPFEFNVMSELESFHREMSAFNETREPSLGVDTNIFFSTTSPDVLQKPKSKIPAVGEKISLFFYLFLQCQFVNENDCALELIGDLYSKEDSNIRNFLQITKSDFVRLESNSPNVLLLQSTKTYKDFLSEINFLYKGSFRFIKRMPNQDGEIISKSKEFLYNIMEIKKHINPSHRIVVEVNLNKYYDDMINMSKKIKKEMESECKRIVSLDALKPEMIKLKDKLSDKMLHLAEADEFEKANLVKNDISFIDNKLKIVDNLEEKIITQKEYYKTFCLSY